MLVYPNARAFAQAIRQRYSALDTRQVLVVVEGATDKRALLPILRPNVRFLPARGRGMVLSAYSDVVAEGLSRCLFIVDCDNDFPAHLKGRPELVITQHRDIEADSLFTLGGFDRVALEYLGMGYLSADEVAIQRDELLRYAIDLCSAFTMVKDCGRSLGFPLRIRDSVTGTKVRLSIEHLPLARTWIQTQIVPDMSAMTAEVGGVLGWSATQVAQVSVMSQGRRSANCRLHASQHCSQCRKRKHCNGHDLVQAIAIDLSSRISAPVTADALDRDIRMTTNWRARSAWIVEERIRAWEQLNGVSVLPPLSQ